MNIGITNVIDIAFQVYIWLIIIRIILSWIRINIYPPFNKFIYEITEPLLGLARRYIPPLGMVDFSPIVVFFGLQLLRYLIISLLWSVGIY